MDELKQAKKIKLVHYPKRENKVRMRKPGRKGRSPFE